MKTLLVTTAILGALGVAFGALGAHFLETKLTAHQLGNWNTAVRYQMMHVLAILIILLVPQTYNFIPSARLFLIGIFLFSGSIYLLSLKDLLHLDKLIKFIGPITPIGGIVLIAGWCTLVYQFLKK